LCILPTEFLKTYRMVTFQIVTSFTILHFTIIGEGTSVVQLHIHYQLFTVLTAQYSHHIFAQNPGIFTYINGNVC